MCTPIAVFLCFGTSAPDSGGIGDVDEAELEAEAIREMRTERLNDAALGGVMTRCIVVHARLARDVGGAFRDLATDVGIDPRPRRKIDVILRRPRAPCEAPDVARSAGDVQGFTSERIGDASRKGVGCDRL